MNIHGPPNPVKVTLPHPIVREITFTYCAEKRLALAESKDILEKLAVLFDR